MAIQPVPQQAINQCFSPVFQQKIQANFSQEEIQKFFTPEGIMLYVSKDQEEGLSPEMQNTCWKVHMSWHRKNPYDSESPIDGIFFRALSEKHSVAWIVTPTSDKKSYEPCYVNMSEKTIQQTLPTSNIDTENEGEGRALPEIPYIILSGKKVDRDPNAFNWTHAIGGGILLLAIGYIAYRTLSKESSLDSSQGSILKEIPTTP